jgi:hypothetical protein
VDGLPERKIEVKIYLASYFEPENHGPGRKIGISPGKPQNLIDECGYDCEISYPGLSPDQAYWDYHSAKKIAMKENDEDRKAELMQEAADNFVDSYQKILDSFVAEVEKQAQATGKSIFEVIGLEDGDTLLSWERCGHTTYREHAAKALVKLGCEVVEK